MCIVIDCKIGCKIGCMIDGNKCTIWTCCSGTQWVLQDYGIDYTTEQACKTCEEPFLQVEGWGGSDNQTHES